MITQQLPQVRKTPVVRLSKISRKVLAYTLLTLFSIITIFPFLWMLSTSFKSPRAVFA